MSRSDVRMTDNQKGYKAHFDGLGQDSFQRQLLSKKGDKKRSCEHIRGEPRRVGCLTTPPTTSFLSHV